MSERTILAKWTDPAPILTIVGAVSVGLGSYMAFQKSSSEQLHELQWRIEANEKKNDEQEIHMKATDAQVLDHSLRLDRIEQRAGK